MPKYEEKKFEGVTVEWLDWSGPFLPPKKTLISNCTVIDKEFSFATIILPPGDAIRKRKTEKGFKINGIEAGSFLQNPSSVPSPSAEAP